MSRSLVKLSLWLRFKTVIWQSVIGQVVIARIFAAFKMPLAEAEFLADSLSNPRRGNATASDNSQPPAAVEMSERRNRSILKNVVVAPTTPTSTSSKLFPSVKFSAPVRQSSVQSQSQESHYKTFLAQSEMTSLQVFQGTQNNSFKFGPFEWEVIQMANKVL